MGRIRLVVVIGCLSLLLHASGSAARTGSPVLLESRTVELPGMRLLSLSPDGSRLAASSSDLDRLCLYDLETLAEEVCADLTPLEARLRLDDVVWSPDGTKLVLAEDAFRLLVDGDLWLMDTATGELTNLTDDGVNGRIPLLDGDKADFSTLWIDVSPAWLPDGSGIAFSRSTWQEGVWLGNTIETLSLADMSMTTLITISPDLPGVVYYGMRWTADSSRLFYSVYFVDNSNPANGIWSVGADGDSPVQHLGTDPESGPPVVAGISPDGSTVLGYYAAAAGQYARPENPLYMLVDIATGEATPIEVTDPTLPEFAFLRPVVLSPDGHYLAIVTRLTDPDFQVVIREIATGEETTIVPEGLPGAGPITLTAPLSWSNNGELLLLSDPGSGTVLHIDGVSDLQPVPPATPIAESTPISGDTVELMVVTNDNDVPLRAAPGTDAQTVATLAAGTALQVVGPAIEVDGHQWLPVIDPATKIIGYVRLEFVDEAA